MQVYMKTMPELGLTFISAVSMAGPADEYSSAVRLLYEARFAGKTGNAGRLASRESGLPPKAAAQAMEVAMQMTVKALSALGLTFVTTVATAGPSDECGSAIRLVHEVKRAGGRVPGSLSGAVAECLADLDKAAVLGDLKELLRGTGSVAPHVRWESEEGVKIDPVAKRAGLGVVEQVRDRFGLVFVSLAVVPKAYKGGGSFLAEHKAGRSVRITMFSAKPGVKRDAVNRGIQDYLNAFFPGINAHFSGNRVTLVARQPSAFSLGLRPATRGQPSAAPGFLNDRQSKAGYGLPVAETLPGSWVGKPAAEER